MFLSGGFVPKDPPEGTLYVPDKYRTTTERVSVQTTVHFDEPVVGHQPPGSGNLWHLVCIVSLLGREMRIFNFYLKNYRDIKCIRKIKTLAMK